MPTTVTFYTEPTNLDYLMLNVRLEFGDLTGAVYSDDIIRTALVSSVIYLQNRWQSKYQVFSEDMIDIPQPAEIPAGMVWANTTDGQAFIPAELEVGSVFRNPFIIFTQASPPVIQSIDERAIILGALYILRRLQISSSSTAFVSWSTEDIRYSNLGSERSLSKLLESDLEAINNYFAANIATPQRSVFPIAYIPGLHDNYT